jgi:hypothetical protein
LVKLCIFRMLSLIVSHLNILLVSIVFVCIGKLLTFQPFPEGPGGSMSWVVGLPNNSYKPITNTAWVRARLCKLQKKAALDSQPQVIKFSSCLPMVGGSLRVLRLPPLKLPLYS